MNAVSTSRSRNTNFFRTFFLAIVAALTLAASASAITITVDIGRKSRDCRGFGICSVTIDPLLSTNQARAEAEGALHGDQLTLSFLQPVRGAENVIVIDEPIELDPKTAQELGAAHVVIMPGSYPVDYSSNPNGEVTLPTQRIGITINVETGRKSKGCTGFGICSITIEVDLLQHPTPATGALDGDVLTLDFAAATPEREDVIVIDEDILLSPATSQALGSSDQRVVKRGSYPVDYSSNPNGTVQLATERFGITLHVKLGRRNMGCTGFGICRIWIDADLAIETTPAQGSLKGNSLHLEFQSKPNEHGKELVIDEPVELDEETSIALGARKVTLLPGTYTVDYSSNPNGSVDVKALPIGITIGVDIGRRSKNCRGLGVCSITIEIDLRQGTPTTTTIASLKDSTLTLLFMSELPEQGDTFTVEDEMDIDSRIARSLGAKSLHLKKGTYPIRRDAEGRPYVELPVAQRGITITIYVGRGEHCTRFGICRITLEVNLSDPSGRATQAIATAENGALELDFLGETPDRESMMILDYGVTLDSATAAALGFSEILPGEYPVDYANNENGIVQLRTAGTSASVDPEMSNATDGARAFPNPTSNSATLHFYVPQNGPVTVNLTDARGNLTAQLLNTTLEAGEQSLNVDASDLADGVYFFTVHTAAGTESGRMVVTH